MVKKVDVWREIRLEGNFNVDLASGALYSLGCIGIVEKKNSLIAYFNTDKKISKEEVTSALIRFGVKDVKVSIGTIVDNGWSRRWEKYFEPVRVGNLYIRPPWAKEPPGNLTDIVINPGGAFGTGTHPTTQMALYFLEKYLGKGMTVLDAGCGSGILAIAAAKLGAQRVVCVDNDEGIKENFYENVSLNRVQENIELKICDVFEIKSFDFDLVVSNIDIMSSIKLLNSIRDTGKFPRRMIFTGILIRDMESLSEQLTALGLKIADRGTLGEWGAIVA